MDTSTVLTDGAARLPHAGSGNLASEAAFRGERGRGFPSRWPWGSKAAQVMPNGVPMAWMAGLFCTPPLWLSHVTGGPGSPT